MDIIANAGAIGRFVISPINFHIWFYAKRYFEHIWYQMGFDSMIFSELCGGSGRVEIAEGNKFQVVYLVVPAQDFFECEFGFAVRVDRLSRQSFIDRQTIGRSENCTSR